MNERINELRLEAGISRLHDEPKFMVAVSEEGKVIEPLDGLKKFAELIVQECLAIIQTEVSMKYKDGWEQHGVSDDWAAGHYNASLHSRALLKRHFGVGE